MSGVYKVIKGNEKREGIKLKGNVRENLTKASKKTGLDDSEIVNGIVDAIMEDDTRNEMAEYFEWKAEEAMDDAQRTNILQRPRIYSRMDRFRLMERILKA